MSRKTRPGKMISMLAVSLLAVGLLEVGEVFGAAASELARAHSGGGVTVKVTYLNPQGADGPRFQVVLDTHSVDLDAYDLKSLSSLRDGAGKPLKPTEMKNKGSGHHREVTLTFPKLSAQPSSLEIVIRDIAGVKQRVFRWEF
ncbi:MAG: hypothetical protein HYV04_01370 [Deltaproteobacteria bacterium]|nr:hypothetical protein [Deltaproteobacteria bacterium]